MLRFSQFFAASKEADTMIRQAINSRLISLMDDVLNWCGIREITDLASDDGTLNIKIRQYFPQKWLIRNPEDIFSGLYMLFREKGSMVPDLEMEYLLHQIIRERIEMSDLFGLGTISRLENRQEIEDMMLVTEDSMSQVEIRSELDYLEDLRNYADFCFWDMDFLILDTPLGEKIMGGYRYGA